jgi:large subunit ribosomal protein L13e
MTQAAGIPRKLARTIGIAVDPRRQNLSEESLKFNVERLQEYKKRLILFPRNTAKPKKGDAPLEEVKKAKSKEGIVRNNTEALPIKNVVKVSEIDPREVQGEEGGAYRKLRIARSNARLVGVREKRAKAKAEEAAATKK